MKHILTPKKAEKKKNVYNSIVVITVFSSFMSVYPTTSVEKNGIRKAKLNHFWTYCVSMLYLVIYTFCLITANVEENIITSKKEYDFNRIAYLLYLVTVVTEIIAVYLQYAMTIFATHKLLSILELMRKSDSILGKIGYKFKYVAGFVINITVISFGMYFIALNIGLEIWNSRREGVGTSSVFESIVLGWPQFLIHLVESMFILSNMLLYTRFFAVNLIMETLFRNNGGKEYLMEPQNFMSKIYKYEKDPEESDEYVIYSCMKSFYFLYRVTVKNNHIFGLMLTLSALIQFTTIAFAICFCYYRITTKPVAATIWLLWAAIRIFELVRKAYTVHLVRNEADRCMNSVNKLMMLSWNSKITQKLTVFAQQLNHCKVEYTACGLFPVDGTLVFTIIAAATMYLIVTYQFQQGLNRNCSNNTSI